MSLQGLKQGWRQHVFVNEKCEILHLWPWKQKHFKQHHEKLYIPFHENTTKGVFSSNLWIKYNQLNLKSVGGKTQLDVQCCEKNVKVIQHDGMIRYYAKSHAPEPIHMHDFKQAW